MYNHMLNLRAISQDDNLEDMIFLAERATAWRGPGSTSRIYHFKLLSFNYYNRDNTLIVVVSNNLFIIKFHFREIKVPSKTY